tara:strand:+ start:4470 stop:4697 length:228 start_codon:yes stop_codon:yes gene_type:complete
MIVVFLKGVPVAIAVGNGCGIPFMLGFPGRIPLKIHRNETASVHQAFGDNGGIGYEPIAIRGFGEVLDSFGVAGS